MDMRNLLMERAQTDIGEGRYIAGIARTDTNGTSPLSGSPEPRIATMS